MVEEILAKFKALPTWGKVVTVLVILGVIGSFVPDPPKVELRPNAVGYEIVEREEIEYPDEKTGLAKRLVLRILAPEAKDSNALVQTAAKAASEAYKESSYASVQVWIDLAASLTGKGNHLCSLEYFPRTDQGDERWEVRVVDRYPTEKEIKLALEFYESFYRIRERKGEVTLEEEAAIYADLARARGITEDEARMIKTKAIRSTSPFDYSEE